MRSKIPGALVSLISVVLFEHDIVAGLFEENFDQVCAVRVVVNDQDASFLFDERPGDPINFRLIEPINMRPRWILADHVRSVDVKAVSIFDNFEHTGYFGIYSVSDRPERHSPSVDLVGR